MSDSYAPRPEHRFTFGLWTVGNPGRDPFGNVVREELDPVDTVYRLAELGAYGISFHDNDLVPYGASASEGQTIIKRFRHALDETGMKVPMATTNLFWRPIFKEGAFTANDPNIRRFAVKKTCEAMELGAELGAEVQVMWGGREGAEVDAAKDVRAALDRYKEAVDLCCEHIRDAWPWSPYRPRTQAERTAGRHPAPHRRPCAGFCQRARMARDGGAEP